jgi:hypothetical protein
MSETDSHDEFAFGTWETDSPQHDVTCHCPIWTAFNEERREEIQYKNRDLIDSYDGRACDYYRDRYGLNGYTGTLTEDEAIMIWEEVMLEFKDSEHNNNYEIARNVAEELGWLEDMAGNFQ